MINMLKLPKGQLEDLLRKTQRMCNINGKPMPQVIGCVIECIPNADVAVTTSIVRDGKTSVASFVTPCDDFHMEEGIVIPDIAKALGVLKAHAGIITLEKKDDKLVFRSSGKQTTISADPRALAFPHTKKSISLWNEESQERLSVIDGVGRYTMSNGEVREPVAKFELRGEELRNAINTGNINGQKVNRCTLSWDGDRLWLMAGSEMLGRTTTCLFSSEPMFDPFCFEFEGGLENCVSNGKLTLYILDFNPEGQGYSMVIYSDDSKIFQRGVV